MGAGEGGYYQQPRYTAQLPALLACLEDWIQEQGDIAFMLHGGDVVETVTPEAIRMARDVFSLLSVPVYVSLGNHDLAAPDAVSLWMANAPDFFPGQHPTYTLMHEACTIHIVPTQWCATPYFWGEGLSHHFLPEQHIHLDSALKHYSDSVHFLCTHGEVLSVPVEQTGFDAPYHGPPPSFTRDIADLARCHPQLRSVLSAHTHINMHQCLAGVHYVTVSAFVETPFEFKVFEVTPTQVTMCTLNLLPRVGFNATYDFDKTFVQGRAKDRAF